MPRKKGKKTPTITDGFFQYFDEHSGRVTKTLDVRQQPETWLAEVVVYLKSVRLIYTEPQTGFEYTCTFIRQKHPDYKKKDKADKRVMGVWYGHKRVEGRLQKKYVGKNDNMTLARMHQVAQELCQQIAPTLQPSLFDNG